MIKLEKENPKWAFCLSCGDSLVRTILIWDKKKGGGQEIPLCKKCRLELAKILVEAKEK